MFWEFKNNKNEAETMKKKKSLLIVKSENDFQNFVLTIRHWKLNPDQVAYQNSIQIL